MIFSGSRATCTQKCLLLKVSKTEHLSFENSFSTSSREPMMGIFSRNHPTHRLTRTGYCSGLTPPWVSHITHCLISKIWKQENGRIARTVRGRPTMWPPTRKPSSLCTKRSQARLVWISLSGSNNNNSLMSYTRTFLPRHPPYSSLTRGLPFRNAFPSYRTSYFVSIID